jgi:hypothetical protein
MPPMLQFFHLGWVFPVHTKPNEEKMAVSINTQSAEPLLSLICLDLRARQHVRLRDAIGPICDCAVNEVI